jgi:hypothetical protein
MLMALGIGAEGARLPQTAAPPQAPESEIKLTPSEIELYKSAQTLIDWTPSQIQHSPYLHKLRPAGRQDQLPTILDRVGQTVTRMFHNFRNVSCDEKIVSAAYRYRFHNSSGGNYLPGSHVSRRFRYIIVRRPRGDLPAFAEYRTDLKGNPIDVTADDTRLQGFFMITWDFASTFLYLSPADQHDNRYRYLGIQTIRNRECHVVGFAQDPEKVQRGNRFYIGSYGVVNLVQGMAWIDTQTFQILRVMIWLLAPRKDIGLSSQTSTVDFFPVRPSGTDKVLWLPRDVRVEDLYRGMKVRNIHQYSNYKLFRVESTIKP